MERVRELLLPARDPSRLHVAIKELHEVVGREHSSSQCHSNSSNVDRLVEILLLHIT
jgi:hypothetical protein